MPLFQMLGAIIGSLVLAGTASIAWPKFTEKPLPKVLTQVHDVAANTKPGKSFENVLGVSEESTDSGDALKQLLDSAKVSAQQAISKQVLLQLLSKFNQLPDDQQDIVREQICKPNE